MCKCKYCKCVCVYTNLFIALRRRRLGAWGLSLKVLLSGRYKEVLGFGFGNWGQEKGFRVSNLTTKGHYTTHPLNYWKQQVSEWKLYHPMHTSLSGSSPPHLPPLSPSLLLLHALGMQTTHVIFLWPQWYFYDVNYMRHPHAFMGIPYERVTCRYIILYMHACGL